MSEQRSTASAVAALDAMGNYGKSGNDPETVHMEADRILLQCVPPEVQDAWLRLFDRCGFWYA